LIATLVDPDAIRLLIVGDIGVEIAISIEIGEDDRLATEIS